MYTYFVIEGVVRMMSSIARISIFDEVAAAMATFERIWCFIWLMLGFYTESKKGVSFPSNAATSWFPHPVQGKFPEN